MSKQILLVQDNDVLTEIISIGITKSFGVDIVVEKDFEKAKARLVNEEYVLIIVDQDAPKDAASRLIAYLPEIGRELPLITLVYPSTAKKGFADKLGSPEWILKPDVMRELKKFVAMYVEINPKDSKPTHDEYLGIKLNTLLTFNRVGGDCYIKLSGKKYVKVLSADDYFGQEDFDKYHQKNIDMLYVKNDEVEIFLERLTNDLVSLQDLSTETSSEALEEAALLVSHEETKKALEEISGAIKKAETSKLSYAEGMTVTEHTLGTIHQVASKIGMNKDVQQLTKATVTVAIGTIKKSPDLNKLFEKLTLNPDSYLSSHSLLLANISCLVSGLMGWKSDLTFYKLTMASFLHDITLEDDSLAKIKNIVDLTLKADKFNEKQIEKYLHHPEDAASKVGEFRQIPPDVNVLVTQHHERPDGSGFPNKINYKKLGSLSTLLIVAHDLVDYIADHQHENWNLVSFLNRYRPHYQEGFFKDIFGVMWGYLVHAVGHDKAPVGDIKK